MNITDRAMRNLSFALGLAENTDANTLMLNAAVRINRLTAEYREIVQLAVDAEIITRSRCKELIDMSHSEIGKLFANSPIGRETAERCYQIASSHEFGPDAAKTIRETFKLKI